MAKSRSQISGLLLDLTAVIFTECTGSSRSILSSWCRISAIDVFFIYFLTQKFLQGQFRSIVKYPFCEPLPIPSLNTDIRMAQAECFFVRSRQWWEMKILHCVNSKTKFFFSTASWIEIRAYFTINDVLKLWLAVFFFVLNSTWNNMSYHWWYLKYL